MELAIGFVIHGAVLVVFILFGKFLHECDEQLPRKK